jgi:Nif-specific regulatory protein
MNDQILKDKCNLYRLLLYPDTHKDDDVSCIEKALGLVKNIVGARLGYIELEGSGNEVWSACQCDEGDLNIIRSRISSTIIKEALQTGETIVTPSAMLDDRFSGARSVVAGQIESVLCSPINNEGMNGVIYLQGDLSGLCESTNIDEAELFSQNIRPLLKRLKYHLLKTHPEDDLRRMYDLKGVIGDSPAFNKVLNEAMTIAPLNVPLLMNGETGTGKTHLAKIIHLNSSRKQHNFIHINCANLPETLFESELFGAAKGAFSGATSDIKGKINAADGGTLFLDEISEMPVAAQAKLLQFLDEGFYYPLGSNTAVTPDVRIIVASNIDFAKQIEAGTFRKDLYYRISNFPIIVPPIRERTADIGSLADFFIRKIESEVGQGGFELSATALYEIKKYDWPGNIRELHNKLQQGLIKAKIAGQNLIEAEYIFQKNSQLEPLANQQISFAGEKDKWEKQFIQQQLENNTWNVTRTAAALKMSRSHLNRLIKEYQLIKPDYKGQ